MLALTMEWRKHTNGTATMWLCRKPGRGDRCRSGVALASANAIDFDGDGIRNTLGPRLAAVHRYRRGPGVIETSQVLRLVRGGRHA